VFTEIMTAKVTALQWGVVIGASLAAAIIDLRTRRIPNIVTVPLLAAGFLYAALNDGLEGFVGAAAACVLLALPFVLMFLFAGGGAGDAKFMGAIGAWLGLPHGVIVLLSVGAVGIVLAIGKALAAGKLRAVLASTYLSFYSFVLSLMGYGATEAAIAEDQVNGRVGLTVPYGVSIFLGVCAAGVFVLLWQG
jgi:prepilin peptidase CpaA